ncbi:MAG: hypothetical protein V1493_03625, partial [Candidatus Diapherotrites archaeon]
KVPVAGVTILSILASLFNPQGAPPGGQGAQADDQKDESQISAVPDFQVISTNPDNGTVTIQLTFKRADGTIAFSETRVVSSADADSLGVEEAFFKATPDAAV